MISLQNQEKTIGQRHEKGVMGILGYLPLPMPYCENGLRAKAIGVSCDPSNKQDKRINCAFALPTVEEYGFTRFVSCHLFNVPNMGTSWEAVYVQNVCQNHFHA